MQVCDYLLLIKSYYLFLNCWYYCNIAFYVNCVCIRPYYDISSNLYNDTKQTIIFLKDGCYRHIYIFFYSKTPKVSVYLKNNQMLIKYSTVEGVNFLEIWAIGPIESLRLFETKHIPLHILGNF